MTISAAIVIAPASTTTIRPWRIEGMCDSPSSLSTSGLTAPGRPTPPDRRKPCNPNRRCYAGSVLRAIGAVVCGAALATGAAAVAAPPGAEGADWASAILSNAHAGARPVALVVSLHTELQCGKLRGNALALTFPAAARLPQTISASAIVVAGKRSSSVKVAGRTVSITMAPPTGMMCDSIAPGTAKILVSRAAQLGNPAAAGTYRLSVRYGTETLNAQLTITS